MLRPSTTWAVRNASAPAKERPLTLRCGPQAPRKAADRIAATRRTAPSPRSGSETARRIQVPEALDLSGLPPPMSSEEFTKRILQTLERIATRPPRGRAPHRVVRIGSRRDTADRGSQCRGIPRGNADASSVAQHLRNEPAIRTDTDKAERHALRDRLRPAFGLGCENEHVRIFVEG